MMHEGLWRQLEKLDGPETARRANCRYRRGEQAGKYVIDLLNQSYVVDMAQKQIFPAAGAAAKPAGFTEQLCILAYLIQAVDQPLSHKLVKAETLASGEFFFRGIHEMPTDKLSAAFGNNPQKLYQAAEKLNARPGEYGDASLELLILPRLPVTIVIWAGDDEFQPRASILFDQTAGDHIALDALGAAASLTVSALTETAAEPAPG